MSNLKMKIGQLFIQNQESKKSTIKTFVAEPTPLEEKNLGTVYSVIEITTDNSENEEIIDIINQGLASAYYQSTEFDPETAFETGLKNLNKKMQQVISEVGEEWLDDLNAVIAVQKDKELHFAQIGRIHAFLTQDNKIIELGGNTKGKINPLKIFSNILSGNLNSKSTVVFCTESILDYISQEKLRKTVIDNSPSDAAIYLQNLLTENNAHNNFASLILRLSEDKFNLKTVKEDDEIEKTSIEDGSDSMSHLVDKEKTTSELLSPSIWPNIKKNLSKIKQKKDPQVEKPRSTNDSPALKMFKKVLAVLKNIGIQILNGIMYLVRFILGLFKNKKEYQNKFKKIPSSTTNSFSKTINWLKALPLPRKILLILIILIVFVLAQSLMRMELNKESKEDLQRYEQIVEDIQQKISEVDNLILMNNEDGAQKLISESREKLAEIPEDSSVFEENGADIKSKIQIAMDKVFNINRLSDPKIAIDFSSISSELSLGRALRIGDTIYAFDNSNDGVYSGGIEGGDIKTSVEAENNFSFKSSTKDSAATALSWTSNDTLVQFNPVLEKLSDVEIGQIPDGLNVKAMQVFGSRLYALGDNGKVYKFTADGDSYGDSDTWLNDDVKLENPKSMAIDGAVYIIDGNGELKKFFSGERDKDFELEQIEPKLENADVIYTDENITSIYILDRDNNRALRFNKEGNLTSQYISDKFDNLIDLVVDEDTGTLYLLNGNQIYGVKI